MKKLPPGRLGRLSLTLILFIAFFFIKVPSLSSDENSGTSIRNVVVTDPESHSTVESPGKPSPFFPGFPNLGFDLIFNTKDLFLGGSYEHPLFREHILEIAAGIFFYIRPFDKTSFEQTGPGTYNQYKEKRYITGVKLSQKIWLGEYGGIFGGAGYGYTFGSFNGTESPTHDQWTPYYLGGLFLSFGGIVNGVSGYQYTRIPHSPDHFIFISVSVSFSLLRRDKNKNTANRP